MAEKRTPIYQGKLIDLGIEQVQLPGGKWCELEIIRHPGGAAAVALNGEGKVCLLRQFRHAAGGWLWELPAGKIDPSESPLETAQRELAEEAGLTARTWESLGSMFSSPGVFTEVIFLYLARGLTAVERSLEEHEVIEVHWIPFSEVIAWASSGTIVDAKTLIGLYRVQAFLQLGAQSSTNRADNRR